MPDPITGGCLCGGTRYTLGEGIRFCLFCHCRDCQRITGAGHAALFGAARRSTEVIGALNAYDYQAESGAGMHSVTCRTCGSPVYKLSSRHPELFFFHAATLDQPERFVPTRSVWARRATPWDRTDPALPAEP